MSVVLIDNFSDLALGEEDDVGEPLVCLNPRKNVITGLSEKQTCGGYVQNLKNVAMRLQTMNEKEISERANIKKQDPTSSSEAQFWKGDLRLENGKKIQIFKKEVPAKIHDKSYLKRELKIYNCIVFNSCSPFFVFPLRVTHDYVITEYGIGLSLNEYHQFFTGVQKEVITLYLQLHIAISELPRMNICHGDLHLGNILVCRLDTLYGDQKKWAFDTLKKEFIPHTENGPKRDDDFTQTLGFPKDADPIIIESIIKIFDWDNAYYLPDIPDISPHAADDLLSDRKRLEIQDKLTFIRNVSRNIDHEFVVSAIKGLGFDESSFEEIQNFILHDYLVDPLDEDDEKYEEKPNPSRLNFKNKGIIGQLGYFYDQNDMEFEILAVMQNEITYYNRSTQKQGTRRLLPTEEMDIWVGARHDEKISDTHETKQFHYDATNKIFEDLYDLLRERLLAEREQEREQEREREQELERSGFERPQKRNRGTAPRGRKTVM